MTEVIGYDIGGANTKVAFIKTRNGVLEEVETDMAYFPVWKKSMDLPTIIESLRTKVSNSKKLDCIAVTMTAELSDVYRTKREGVVHILEVVEKIFPKTPIMILDVEGKLQSIEEAKAEPLQVAAANWAATGWLVSKFFEQCIIIDIGSTSASIIPVVDGLVAAKGKTDLEKLMKGELVYTGCLRTNIASFVSKIPVRGGFARVSSELFAQTGDVHLILGNIRQEQYSVETADGRGKTKADAMGRLARVVCADTEALSEEDIIKMAQYIYSEQVNQIVEGLNQVRSQLRKFNGTVVVTGLGKEFLASKAARKAGFDRIIDLNNLIAVNVSQMSPAVAVAIMAIEKIGGEPIKWKQ